MGKKPNKQKAGGEVLRNAKEMAKIEEYWHLLGLASDGRHP